ncbi:hypothetical protein [Roseomonas sp. AR75]|uniref:hypothetical protein n=1 Tax=Roseomonas sp. AR75 TaxID=2562311 RepID=UPI0010C151F6|nr:hypothetical protein [Roseomonas sp. AR75]
MTRAARLRPLDEARFTAWLQRAEAGERLTYWRGHLAIDASPLASRLGGEDRLELDRVSRLAWNMAQQGWLDLLQQRHGAHDFSYVAVRRRHEPAMPARLAA